MSLDPRDQLVKAMAELGAYRGTGAYRAFYDALRAIEGVHVEDFGSVKPEALPALQQQYRQVVALRKAMEADEPGREMPIP